jgi:dihydrofolate synthase/folylpolyglutamate synthase
MLTSVLIRAGYRVGTYTSPHLVDVRERIVLNGKPISKKETQDLLLRLTDVESQAGNRRLTYFETLTLLSLMYFNRKRPEFVIWETGLGGRWDTTNIIPRPVITIITNIALDHTKILGRTLTRIAREKAGIIKRGVPVVTGETKPGPLNVIASVARRRSAKLYRAGNCSIMYYPKVLPGAHQDKNARIAQTAIDVLRNSGFRIPERYLQEGIEKARITGRGQLIEKIISVDNGLRFGQTLGGQARPYACSDNSWIGHNKKIRVVLDVAHNPAGIRALRGLLQSGKFLYNKLLIVIGMMKDKDDRKIASVLGEIADHGYLTRAQVSRAENPEVIANVWPNHRFTIVDSVQEAVRKALIEAQPEDIVCITGSHYVVGEAISELGVRVCLG